MKYGYVAALTFLAFGAAVVSPAEAWAGKRRARRKSVQVAKPEAEPLKALEDPGKLALAQARQKWTSTQIQSAKEGVQPLLAPLKEFLESVRKGIYERVPQADAEETRRLFQDEKSLDAFWTDQENRLAIAYLGTPSLPIREAKTKIEALTKLVVQSVREFEEAKSEYLARPSAEARFKVDSRAASVADLLESIELVRLKVQPTRGQLFLAASSSMFVHQGILLTVAVSIKDLGIGGCAGAYAGATFCAFYVIENMVAQGIQRNRDSLSNHADQKLRSFGEDMNRPEWLLHYLAGQYRRCTAVLEPVVEYPRLLPPVEES